MEPGSLPGPLARLEFERQALSLADEVYRTARDLVGSDEKAARLVEETYRQAFRSWRSFRSGRSLRAWFVAILTALDADRGRPQNGSGLRAVEATDSPLFDVLGAAADLDEEQAIARLSPTGVVEAVSALPREERDAVVIVDIGEFTSAEAARILGLPLQALVRRLHWGRRLLDRRLAEAGEPSYDERAFA